MKNIQPRGRLPDRLEYLDSLRGIAAILVVLHHIYQTAPFWSGFVRFSPFRLLLNGRSSVIFFFVLSGFVLAYGLLRGDQPTRFVKFALRRLARIYVPYLVAGLIAIGAMIVLSPSMLPDTAVTFNEMWQSPIDWKTALGHLGLIGTNEANSINTPSWSLVYELRISLLIPALCFFASRSFCLFLGLSSSAYILNEIVMARLALSPVPYGATGVAENFLFTVHFAAYFVVGLLLAKAATVRADWLYNMQGRQKTVLILIGGPLLFVFRDAAGAIGAAIVIILAINSSAFQTFLRKPILLWLGRISFSLYLTHTIVLQIVVRLLHGYVPLSLSLVATLILIFPIAALFFQFVEMPAIQLSRWIGRREIPADAVGDQRG